MNEFSIEELFQNNDFNNKDLESTNYEYKNSTEITELRKSGNLDLAYKIAKKQLENNPDNILDKRSLGWCIYDYLKQNNSVDNKDVFIRYLNELKNIDLPATEKKIFDKSTWQIFYLLNDCNKNKDEFGTIDFFYIFLDELFDIIKNFHFTKPSKEYSLIFDGFYKAYKDKKSLKEWGRFKEFCEWWNFDNFTKEDYNEEKFKDKNGNNRTIMSLVERGYIAYSKILLAYLEKAEYYNNNVDLEHINEFLNKITKVIDSRPDYVFPLYHKAKILLQINRNEEAYKTLKPFMFKKQNEFWAWELLGDTIEDKDLQFACYCKALSCSAKKEMTINLRQKIALMFVDKKLYDNAKTEIENVINIRLAKQWNINKNLLDLKDKDWYKNANINKNILDYYKKEAIKAEEILYENLPETTIFIENINLKKGFANFITENKIKGFFKFSNLNKVTNNLPELYKVYNIKIKSLSNNLEESINISSNKPTNVVSIKLSDEQDNSTFFNYFHGQLKLVSSFGFVKDVFVPQDLISGFANNQEVVGKAVLSFDNKKKIWGWRAISIE